MRVAKLRGVVAPIAGAVCLLGLTGLSNAALSYNGNGATGFGGTLGKGSLSLSDDGLGNLTATFNPSGGFGGNDVVMYIDSTPGGFSDTSTLADNGDGGRLAVSAANIGNPSRDLITFPTGFQADYALEFENNIFTGLFRLVAGGNNSLTFQAGSTPTNGGPYTVTFPLSKLGLTQGQSFNFVADLISTSAYGSNETIGTSVAVPVNSGDSPNVGFNGTLTFSSADPYATTAVPEPASMMFVAAGVALTLMRNRRSTQLVSF